VVNSRRKGHQYERDVAKLFREAMGGAEVKRGLQGRGGSEAPDVDCPHFWVETKRGRRPNPRKALEQAERDTDGRVPIAIIRDDYGEAFVVLRLSQFLQMVREWWGK
jgi:hypothetical protein